MLITEYFRKIESQIADCVNILEISIFKDNRSLHIGIIEGKLLFIDESELHFIEFINVKQTTEVYKYSYHYQDRNGNLIFRACIREKYNWDKIAVQTLKVYEKALAK